MKTFVILLVIFCIYNSLISCQSNVNDEDLKLPTILIATLIRNKAQTLPYFFSYLENLSYPKSRIALWFRSDHNEDNSIEMINLWLNQTYEKYHNVDFKYEETPTSHQNESSQTDWPKERFNHIINLKEQALIKADELWADYIFFIDADVFLTSPDTLKHLVSLKLPIVAPMLLSEGLYSNFWGGMSDDYYYQRTDEYKLIYNYKKVGNFAVPMVHSAVLINLRNFRSKLLTFDIKKLRQNQKTFGLTEEQLFQGPEDDIIIFAISANSSSIPMYVSNEFIYGYIMQPVEDISIDLQQIINVKLNIINDLGTDVLINNEFMRFISYPEKDKLTLDRIYMINLERRPERRRKMELCFNELGLDFQYFPAVDGKKLNLEIIKKMDIEFLKGYEDPYSHRLMTMGEIGCFLSHYSIWQEIIEQGLQEVLILEDDIRFEPYFREKAINVLNQARNVGNWDLIYFGRKLLQDQHEPWVSGTDSLVHAGYSYWTLGYVITLEGAKKLVAAQPLKKLIPVDEYLPIMFDRHPNDTLNRAFHSRNLHAYSAAPLIMFPTRYTGEDGYISDTEDSALTSEKFESSDAQLKSDKGFDEFDSLRDESDVNLKHKAKIFSEEITKSMSNRDFGEL